MPRYTFRSFESYQRKSRWDKVFVMEICLLIKACNREKRTMISYVIDQEDGQTVRTDYTDTNILRRGD